MTAESLSKIPTPMPSSSGARRLCPGLQNELYLYETWPAGQLDKPQGSVVKNVPAAGNIWYAPYHENLFDADQALPVNLPPECTVRFVNGSHADTEVREFA